MGVELTMVHYVYLLGIVAIIGFMVAKKDTSIVCMVGIFVLGLILTGSIFKGVSGVFNAFVYAINQLASTILIISVITALCKILEVTGINEQMVSPVTRFIKNPTSAYWVIGMCMFVMSSFFWPSPAVALLGAVFLPVALRAKLPAMGVAVAMNLFGHGIALSGDYIIQGAPKLVASGAGIPLSEQISASIPLVIVMGVVTTIVAFFFLVRDIKKNKFGTEEEIAEAANKIKVQEYLLPSHLKKIFAILVPVAFALDLCMMVIAKLQGGDATALIGGTALALLIVIAIFTFKGKSFETVTNNIVSGFEFGFKVFGPVIPIAAFFYLGDEGLKSVFGDVDLLSKSTGLVNDLGLALAQAVPINNVVSSITLTLTGVITGLDGSGFSGITLAGSVAKIFAVVIGHGTATLAALGQVAAIWVGGGTVIPWAVIPVAAICGVSPIELAGRNLKPVAIGLAVTTVVAMFLV